jgi:hypothetical protein
MVSIHYDENDGKEYLSPDEAVAQNKTYPFIVTEAFLPVANGEGATAPVLYKGNCEDAAKKTWLAGPAVMGNFIFHEGKATSSEHRFSIDVSDVEYKDEVWGVSYLVKLYPPDPNLPKPIETRPMKFSNDKKWYVFRITDIDFRTQSFIGQIMYCGDSKQEAVDIWKHDDGLYIFRSEALNL